MASSVWRPLRRTMVSTSTVKTRPLYTTMEPLELFSELVEHALQILRQFAGEFHSPAVARVLEHQLRRVQEWALEMCHRPQITRDAAVDAAVQRIADDRM